MRGLRCRVWCWTLLACGLVASSAVVYATAGGVHQSLADGKLDMAMMTVAAIRARELWKVTTAVTRTDHVAFEFLVAIGDSAWQSLTETHKRVVAQAARRAERDVRERASALDAAAFEFGRSKGMKIHELSPSEVAEWRACSAGILVDFMEKGGALSQALMHAYGKLRTDPCCSAGPQGGDETRMGTLRIP